MTMPDIPLSRRLLLAVLVLTTSSSCNPDTGVTRAQRLPTLAVATAFGAAPSTVTADRWGTSTTQIGEGNTIPIAGRFVAEIDLGNGEWRWASTESTTVLTRFNAQSNTTDALFYAEGFSSLNARSPSLDLQLFGRWADSSLVVDPRSYRWLARAQLATTTPGFTLEQLDAQTTRVTQSAEAFVQAGTGFTGDPASWSGWRWIGSTKNGLTLRMARISGIWSSNALSNGSGRPAVMWWGSISALPGYGVHFAMLCTGLDGCDVSNEFIYLLDTMRLDQAGILSRSSMVSSQTDLQSLTDRIGLQSDRFTRLENFLLSLVPVAEPSSPSDTEGSSRP
jgi:hypothetical protein